MTEKTKGKKAMKYTLRSSISDCKNNESGAEMGNRVPILSKAKKNSNSASPNEDRNAKPISIAKSNKDSKRISFGNKNNSTATGSAKWDYEDEYKFYLENSMKRKLRSSDTPQPRKLLEIHQGKSTLLPQSIVHNISTDKFHIVPTHHRIDLAGNSNGVLMNGRVVLEKLSTTVFKSDHQSMNSTKRKQRSSSITRNDKKGSKSNTKLTSFQLMELQLSSEPVVTLDKTVVKNYVTVKGIIEKILRPDE